ncbi:MAG TPA: LCP family protein [Acidimicrobiales bacterium]|nr:LCP family protein [Acidimicrobiales bacterium]
MTRETNGTNHETSPRKIANHDRLIAMGDAVNRRSASSRPTGPRNAKRRWVRRTVIGLGLVVVLIIAGVAADYYYLGSLVNRVNVNTLQNSSGASENILLIGSTSRCALKVQNAAYGLCSQGVNGVNSDITMVLHLVPSTGSVSLFSIPRDLFVPNARIIGSNKIDAALYEGPSQLITAIEEDFAIPINHFVVLNFDTFANVVNALGGVKMYFPTPIFDAYSGLNIERSGCYTLDGYHALQVVRARHLQIQPNPSNHNPRSWSVEPLSDLARIRRTHEFLRVLATKVAARGLGNPLTDQSIATSVLPDLTVDSGFTEGEMVSLARTFAHTHITNVPQFTFPVTNVETGSLLYQGYYYGDVVFPVQPNGLAAVNKIFDVAAGMNSFTGTALPAPSTLKISVENGTGVANQAASIANPLRAKGFDIVSTSNVTPPGPVSESVVWYGGPPPPKHGNWTSPGLAAAQAVLAQLQGPAILGYNPKNVTPGAIATVETGTGLTVTPRTAAKKTKSTHTTTTSTAKSSVTTTTAYVPPGIKGNSKFTAPSAVSAALAPYDPRSCNAAGTGPGPN